MADWKIKGIFKADADKVYAEIGNLESITPQNVLDKAKNKKSELHKCFEWDDNKAAEKYRLTQARQIIQLLVITPVQEEVTPVRIFQISSERNEYKENHFFMENKDEYRLLLDRAKAELEAIKKRYSTLSELEEVFEAIDNL